MNTIITRQDLKELVELLKQYLPSHPELAIEDQTEQHEPQIVIGLKAKPTTPICQSVTEEPTSNGHWNDHHLAKTGAFDFE